MEASQADVAAHFNGFFNRDVTSTPITTDFLSDFVRFEPSELAYLNREFDVEEL